MKFSENWLRSFVDPPADRDELCRRLTMAGLEVEAVDALGAGLDGVVVGEIVECVAHPNADKLRVCKVAVGADAPLQIVCGAPNARVGLKAPLATIGVNRMLEIGRFIALAISWVKSVPAAPTTMPAMISAGLPST